MSRYVTEFGTLSVEHPLRKFAKLVMDGAPQSIKTQVMNTVHMAKDAFNQKKPSKANSLHWDTMDAIKVLWTMFEGDDELAPLLVQAREVHRLAAGGSTEGARSHRRGTPRADSAPGRPDRERRPRGPLDEVAKSLMGMSLDEMYEMASTVLECPRFQLEAKYGHLNPGLQRMNLGNRLRAKERHT